MAVTVRIPVEDVNDQLDDYDVIRLYRGTSPESATTLVDTITLVADTVRYSYSDTAGSATSWYRHTLYNTGTAAETAKSPPYRPATTLNRIIAEAAARAGKGFSSVTTAAGGASTGLIDSVLGDDGVSSKYLEGAWIYIPGAGAADKLRRVAEDGFTVATTALKPTRAWSADAVVNVDISYQVFQLVPPVQSAGQGFSWADACRAAMRAMWFEDQINIGTGDGIQNEFALSTYVGFVPRENILKVYTRTTDDNGVVTDKDASKNGRYWDPIVNGAGDLSVRLSWKPTTEEVVWATVLRTYEEPYDDDDLVRAPAEAAVLGTVWQLYEHMNSVFKTYETEVNTWKTRFISEWVNPPGGVVS